MGGRSLRRLLVINVLVGSSREAAAPATLLIESRAGERAGTFAGRAGSFSR
jgi:hypothetical protein